MVTTPTAPGREDADFDTALEDPEAFYAGPEGVVADASLTLEQKRRFLGAWAEDLNDRLRAAGEGMVAADPAAGAADADTLKRVEAALAQLEAAGTADPAEPRRLWQRLRPPQA